MNINIRQHNRENFKLMNFNHLMQIYETNYHLIQNILDSLADNKILSTIILNNHVIQYEPVSVSKYTIIFNTPQGLISTKTTIWFVGSKYVLLKSNIYEFKN